MKKIIITLLLVIRWIPAIAEVESYECNSEEDSSWHRLTIDTTKKELNWGNGELYEITHNKNGYITGYFRQSFDGVGGAFMVFDKNKMELHYSAIGLFLVENGNGQKSIQRENGSGKCRARK